MPLIKSGSDEAFETNLKKLLDEGYPRDQALAISLENQRKYDRIVVKEKNDNFSKMKRPNKQE